MSSHPSRGFTERACREKAAELDNDGQDESVNVEEPEELDLEVAEEPEDLELLEELDEHFILE